MEHDDNLERMLYIVKYRGHCDYECGNCAIQYECQVENSGLNDFQKLTFAMAWIMSNRVSFVRKK